jgi:hypothetical protein
MARDTGTKHGPGGNPDSMGLSLPPTLTLLQDAKRAISVLMDYDGFYPYPKRNFAEEMGWFTRTGKPDRARVEAICNLTRDQDTLEPWQQETLAGYVIAYSPRRGGMTLWTPEDFSVEIRQWVHSFEGDLQRQQQYRTENRRRLADWRAFSRAAFNAGDDELARLCNHAENEIETTGFVSEYTINELWKVWVSRGYNA